MPTTVLDGLDFVNLGPLTTTFTAPASCTSRIGLVHSDSDSFIASVRGFRVDEKCTGSAPGLSDCWPSGSAVDQDIARRWPPAVYYHSPASLCPSGWTIVGSVFKNEDGHAATSWDFAVESSKFVSYEESARSATYSSPGRTVMLYSHNPWFYWHARWAAGLSPGETGIACCPRGFSPMLLHMSCVNFPPLTAWTATTVCESIYSFDPPLQMTPISVYTGSDEVFGLTITSEIELYGTEAPAEKGFSTIRTLQTIDDSGFFFDREGWGTREPPGYMSNFIPVDHSRVILLAHGGPTRDVSDLSTGTAGGEEPSAASETGETDNDENTGGYHRDGLASKIGLILGTWALAVVLGAALIVPL